MNKARATYNYKNYGVLYNWPAAMAGSTGNNRVQGICPEGWHLPRDDEWEQLEHYLADNGYNYDGSIGGGRERIASAMAATTHWPFSDCSGSTGDNIQLNNRSGFSALPGGYRHPDGQLTNNGYYGYWWTSTADNRFNNCLLPLHHVRLPECCQKQCRQIAGPQCPLHQGLVCLLD